MNGRLGYLLDNIKQYDFSRFAHPNGQLTIIDTKAAIASDTGAIASRDRLSRRLMIFVRQENIDFSNQLNRPADMYVRKSDFPNKHKCLRELANELCIPVQDVLFIDNLMLQFTVYLHNDAITSDEVYEQGIICDWVATSYVVPKMFEKLDRMLYLFNEYFKPNEEPSGKEDFDDDDDILEWLGIKT
ncbi:MAG: hypothetical protein KatS3mg087_2196 [Patescibacteria group bacterium]|nr:MAG: hypothetical protein KatS3mg087_2106 [Patescibacteria group bacterium]GIW61130.1 MAG: hypothetical protein KatS3mg087_2196 [Patescibacteria group bacterium]